VVIIESLETGLIVVVKILKVLLEAIAVLCVLLGLLKTAQLAYKLQRLARPDQFQQVRLKFGMWLVLALEFQLGADIVSTTLSSSFESLGKLTIIAIIRTFLNYFLTKEIESQ
jgi:uncharacterized membrane protein